MTSKCLYAGGDTPRDEVLASLLNLHQKLGPSLWSGPCLSQGCGVPVKGKAAQLCPALYRPVDYTVHGFSRPEYWSGQPFPSLGDIPNPGIDPSSPALQADSLPAEPQGKHGVLMGARQKLMQGGGTLPMGHPFIVSLRKLKSRLSLNKVPLGKP